MSQLRTTRSTLGHLQSLARASAAEVRQAPGYALRLLTRGSRSRTSLTSNYVLNEENEQLRFENQQLEEQWQEESWEENISQGARTLCSVIGLWALVRLLRLVDWALDIRVISSSSSKGCNVVPTFSLAAHLVEFTFILGAIKKLLGAAKDPRPHVYFGILFLCFIYLFLLGLPPLALSCSELAAIQKCSAEYMMKAANGDCSLQGQTLVQLMMAWVLLTPRLIPRKALMHCTWLWIGLYFIVAVVMRHLYPLVCRVHSYYDLLLIVALLCLVNCIAMSKKFFLEKGQKRKWSDDKIQIQVTRRMFKLLVYMVPMHFTARMIREPPGSTIAEDHERASILFVMVVNFDQIAARLQPYELLDYLNKYFTLFDEICANHRVTKIETVGEEYVCAVGVVPKDREVEKEFGHSMILDRLIKVARKIMSVQACSKEAVEFKMGIHTGPIVAGVIGQKLPRFRLFGDTINTAARMMQKGLPGELQFGEETYKNLPANVSTRCRGKIEMKGKGEVTTYLLVRDEEPAHEEATDRSQAQSEIHMGKRVSFKMDAQRASADSTGSRTSITEELLAIRAETIPDKDDDGAAEDDPSISVSSSSALAEDLVRDRQPSRPLLAASASSRQQPSQASHTQDIELAEVNSRSEPSDSRRSSFRGSRHHAGTADSMSSMRMQSRLSGGASSRGSLGSAADADSWQHDEAWRRFEELLMEMKQTQTNNDPNALGIFQRLLSLGPGWQDFTKEENHEFLDWYMKGSICKKLDIRLDRQALVVSLVTLVDMSYSMFYSGAFDQPLSPSKPRLPSFRLEMFLCSRLACLFIIIAWRVKAASAAANNFENWQATKVQGRLLASYCAIAILMVVSYDAISISEDSAKESMDMFSKQRDRSVYTLAVMPMYQLVSSNTPLLFLPSCVFVLLAAVAMLYQETLFKNLYFTTESIVGFVGIAMVNSYTSLSNESSLRQRFKTQRAVQLTQYRTESILNTLMPIMVVEATIAQSDLCGFTKLASTRQPQEVVKFIGELFGRFDRLTDKHEIYKVETVGDAYIAGQAEPPLTSRNSPLCVVRFGLDMVRATSEWSRDRGEDVSCRVGVHTGKCIGGIVGSEMQRYHLFGNLITQLEVLESTAPEGRVQVSKACKEAVERQMLLEKIEEGTLIFEDRPEEHLKTSKGEVHEYKDVGGRTYVVRSYTA
eukprot:TRINITY_DN106988_c0_g1_i1.p1 TRINITY_DN106988_c0_g1~~TRINITY_DN106988_c0_g1_i1.p1  ORF type:complete len:1197 (-),score=246.02 TRINITY_DN106988_c0_g1_i1:9-3548(-)